MDVVPAVHRIPKDDTAVLVRSLSVGHGGQAFVDLERRAKDTVSALFDEALEPIAASLAA